MLEDGGSEDEVDEYGSENSWEYGGGAEDEGYEWKMKIEKEEGPAKKKSRRDDLDELREMFGTIMKRLQLATDRNCEVASEMKTLKDWKLDLSYKKPEINVFEMPGEGMCLRNTRSK